MPSTAPRGLSSPIMNAAESRRRNVSYTSPAMAARSPEPAKRCARPQSFSASGEGLRRAPMSARTSVAAASFAPGVIAGPSSSWSRQPEHDLDDEDQPHQQQHQRGNAVIAAAKPHVVAGDMNKG